MAQKSKRSKPKAKPGAQTKRATGEAASRLIDERVRSLGGWRAETLAEVRRLIHEADPDIMEEWKWMGTPVWSHAGNVCTGEAYKQVVKLTFARGAALNDPRQLFNSSLEGNTRRAIDIREGEVLDAAAFKALIRAAVAQNLRSIPAKAKPTPGARVNPSTKAKSVNLLAAANRKTAKAMRFRPMRKYLGSCHCGAVRFEIETDFPELTMCDCSICRRKNALMVKVHESKFKLLSGEECLTEYQFHTKTARHFFCAVCGIYPFHRKRVTPDNFGINVHCLEDFTREGIPVRQTVGAAMP